MDTNEGIATRMGRRDRNAGPDAQRPRGVQGQHALHVDELNRYAVTTASWPIAARGDILPVAGAADGHRPPAKGTPRISMEREGGSLHGPLAGAGRVGLHWHREVTEMGE